MTELTRTASEMFVNTARFLDAYHAVMQPLCTEAKLPPAGAGTSSLYLANNPSYNTAKDICWPQGAEAEHRVVSRGPAGDGRIS